MVGNFLLNLPYDNLDELFFIKRHDLLSQGP